MFTARLFWIGDCTRIDEDGTKIKTTSLGLTVPIDDRNNHTFFVDVPREMGIDETYVMGTVECDGTLVPAVGTLKRERKTSIGTITDHPHTLVGRIVGISRRPPKRAVQTEPIKLS
jgi:hypothetical protein